MRRLLSIAAILFSIYSCRKVEVEASDTLISHTWSPTQTRIVTVDTTTITTRDSAGKTYTVSNYFRLDTTYNPESCIRQSTYAFLQNGISQITNACAIGQPITDTAWSIQPEKVLQIVFIDDPVADTYISKLFGFPGGLTPSPKGFYPYQNGLLIKVNSSEFVVNHRTAENFASGYYVNGLMVDSVVKLTVDRYITFTSR